MQILLKSLVLGCSILAASSIVRADDAATRELVEKAIKQLQGDKQLDKVNGAMSKIRGSVQINGAPLNVAGEIQNHGGDRQRIAVTIMIDGQNITFTSILSRDRGWHKINDSTVEMSDEQLNEAKESAYSTQVSWLLPLKDKAFNLSPFGEIDISGRKAIGVNVTRDKHRTVNLFFDKETLRLVRMDTIVQEEGTNKDVTEETTYSDFKAFDGIQHPTKVSIKRNGAAHADFEVDEFKFIETVDDSTFEKP